MRPFLIPLIAKNVNIMKNLLRNCLVLVAIITITASCQYKFLVEPAVPPPNPDDTISFSLQIEPIFTDLGCTDCHPSFKKPDLTPGNAYNSITSMGLVDTTNPESSILYVHPSPTGGHYKVYTSADAALVLQWITQGAKNN
jgi:hypothetical protein